MKKSNLFIKVVFSLLMVIIASGFVAPNTASAKVIQCECDDFGGNISTCSVPWYRGCRYCCGMPVGRTSSSDITTITDGRLPSVPNIKDNLTSFATGVSSLVNSTPTTPISSTSRVTSTVVEPIAGLLYSLGFFNPATNSTTGDFIVPTSIDSSIITGIDNLSRFFNITPNSTWDASKQTTVNNFNNLLTNAVSQLPSNAQTVYTVGENGTISVFSPTKGFFGNPKNPSNPSPNKWNCCTADFGLSGCSDAGSTYGECLKSCSSGADTFCVLSQD